MTPGTAPASPEAALRAELALARAQVAASPDGLLVVSPVGTVLSVNRRFAEVWGISPTELDRGGDAALAAALAQAAHETTLVSRLRSAQPAPSHPASDEVLLRDGRVLDASAAPLFGNDGEYLGCAWTFRDVTSQRRAEAELQELAAALQASLLPPRHPEIPGMDIATRYRPADRHLALGGDFYDVFRLRTNDWAFAIGDVCGKGAPAATLATLTRYSLRSAAVHHTRPSDVLRDLNRVVASDPDLGERFCSVVFGRLALDACGAWVRLASGGHPRPYVIRRAGWIDLRSQPGMVLGLFEDTEVADDIVGLGPGDAIVMCTDGITEARDESGEMFGEERLPATLLDTCGAPAATVADRIVQEALAFAAQGIDDDVAVMVMRVPEDAGEDPVARLKGATGMSEVSLPLTPYVPGEEELEERAARPAPPREARMKLASDPRSARDARRFVAAVLHSWRMSSMVGGDVELLVSEVAGNAVRHARSEFTVIIRYDGGRVRVEVGDGSRALPQPRQPSLDATGGRGLVLVDALAADWGVRPTMDGKRVWFEIPAA